MLNFGRLSHLARAIGVDQRHIDEVLDDFDADPDAIVHELTLWPSDPTKKPRDVISIRGKWRLIQIRLYRRVFLPKFAPTPVSHGGVRGRSPLTNARAHIGNSHAYVTDVCGFFPSISTRRVNRFFLEHACSYEVARTLTRLCTYDHHLIADHASLASDGSFIGPLLTEGELVGKSYFVCGLNPGRRRSILAKLRTIKWSDVMTHALERRLVYRRKCLVPRGSERPDSASQLPQAEGAIEHSETTDPEWSPAPF